MTDLAHWKARAVVLIIFLVHTAGLLALYDPPAASMDAGPLHAQDWGLHFHHLRSMESFLSEARAWGYNPHFMAGYPSNTIQDASIKLFELAAFLTPGVDSVRAFKLWVFGATAAVPWMVYLTAVLLFAGSPDTTRLGVLAAILGTAYWWNSFPREMFFYGMVGFPVAGYFAWLILALFYRLVTGAGPILRRWLSWSAACIVLLPLHLLGALFVAVPGGALWLARWRKAQPRQALWIGGGIVAALALNSFWLVPFVSHRGDDLSHELVRVIPFFASADPWTFLQDYFSGITFWTNRITRWEKVLRVVLLVLGAWGLVELFRRKRRDLAVLLASGVGWAFFLAYFGSLFESMRAWQPMRFKIPLDVGLALCAAYALGMAWDRSRPTLRRGALAVLFVAGLGASVMTVARTESTADWRLRSEPHAPVPEIVAWLQNSASRDGRVLFEETGDETGFFYDGRYLSPFLAHWTGHQFIGGPINLYNDRHHFAEFHSGMLFKRDIASLTDREILGYLKLYNVATIVVFTPQSVARFLALGEVVSLEHTIGRVHLMRVRQPLSWFLKGEGEVEAGLNRIDCSEVVGSEVILKYHWVEGLRSEPPVIIKPVNVLDDPIPFIKVVAPPGSFRLYAGR